MLAQMKKVPEKGKPSLIEDYVVLLQKLTSRDTSGVSSQIDSQLIEHLHTELLHLQKTGASQDQAFLMSNIKSIIALLS